MLEFCDKCGSMMLPSKDTEEFSLVCNLCGKKKKINEEMVDSYTLNKRINHANEQL